MACLICGNQAENGKSLFEITANPDSVGLLCGSCIEKLAENRPKSMGCGYHSEENPCTNDAAYGTSSLMKVGEPGITTPAGTKRIVDNPLICEAHIEDVEKGVKPDWME